MEYKSFNEELLALRACPVDVTGLTDAFSYIGGEIGLDLRLNTSLTQLKASFSFRFKSNLTCAK